MLIYFFSNQIEVCEKIVDRLLKFNIKAIPIKSLKLFFHILDSDSKLPDLFVMDYSLIQHNVLNIFRYMRNQDRVAPLIFYNDPYPRDGTRAKYWLYILAQHFRGLKVEDKIKSILYEIEHAIESPQIKPYIPLIQSPKPMDTAAFTQVENEVPQLPFNINVYEIKHQLKMPPTVFNLFEQLSYNYNNYLSVDELKNTVLMNAKTASEKSVTSYISRLRSYLKKINTHHFDIIHSANGYKLVIF